MIKMDKLNEIKKINLEILLKKILISKLKALIKIILVISVISIF